MAKIKLLFVHSATADMTEAIDFFEQRKVNVHNAAEKLESVLVNQMRKVLDDSEIYTVTRDGDRVKKSRKELIKLDVSQATLLSFKKMFIGAEVQKYMERLGVNPKSKQMSWFCEAAQKFHLKAVKKLQEYFKTVLNSFVMDNLSGISPNKRKRNIYYCKEVVSSLDIKA